MIDIDDILHEEEIVKITDEQRERIKSLDEVIAYNCYVVKLDGKSNRQYYNFCRRNKCPKKDRWALMTQEQYLLFRLMDIGHSYEFYPELKRGHVQNFDMLFEWEHRLIYDEDFKMMGLRHKIVRNKMRNLLRKK